MIKVLIVDDSRAMRRIIARSMEVIGYHSDWFCFAEDGEQGLTVLLEEKPFLVLTDLYMPKMDGIELVKAVREQTIGCRIGLITVEGDPALRNSALEAGADFFLKKPFTNEQLRKTLSNFVDLHPKQIVEPAPQQPSVVAIAPSRDRLERVLSSFGHGDIRILPGDIARFDINRAPLVLGNIQNGKKDILFCVLLDGITANLITALIMRHDIVEVTATTAQKQLAANGREALQTFLGLLSVLCPLPDPNDVMSVQGLRIFDAPSPKLEAFINKYRDSCMALQISSGSTITGQLVFVRS